MLNCDRRRPELLLEPVVGRFTREDLLGETEETEEVFLALEGEFVNSVRLGDSEESCLEPFKPLWKELGRFEVAFLGFGIREGGKESRAESLDDPLELEGLYPEK